MIQVKAEYPNPQDSLVGKLLTPAGEEFHDLMFQSKDDRSFVSIRLTRESAQAVIDKLTISLIEDK